MKLIAPSYYNDFKCIADKCKHTCCIGWEIDIDSDSLEYFKTVPEIASHISYDDVPHFELYDGDRCPFLNNKNLCNMIIGYGEDKLCQICTDHPRFRNFWSSFTEMGLGLVCEEAGRLILTQNEPIKLITISDDKNNIDIPEDEQYLLELRDDMLNSISLDAPNARLLEYLIYRHLADALYDGMLDARIEFISQTYNEITEKWQDNKIETLIEICRQFSYDVEYNEDELTKRINKCQKSIISRQKKDDSN